MGDANNQNSHGIYIEGSLVKTENVKVVINIFMLIIVFLIIIFLIVHYFIRLHYKTQTEYAVGELRAKFDKDYKDTTGASPFAKKEGKNKDPVKPPTTIQGNGPAVPVGTNQRFPIQMTPDQAAPIIHHMALGKPPKADHSNYAVYYTPSIP